MTMKIAGHEIHPLAECWPRITGEDWDDFRFDVEGKGITKPPVADQFGRIVDGVNRLLAWEANAVVQSWAEHYPLKVETREFKDDSDVFDFIMSENNARRHMTRDQKAIACTAMIDFMNAEIEKRKGLQKGGEPSNNKEGANQHSRSVDPEAGPLTSEEKPQRDIKEKKARSSAGKLAKAAGISHHKAEQAIKVSKASPKLAEKVKAGEVKLADAVAVVAAPEAVARIESGEKPAEVVKEVKVAKREAAKSQVPKGDRITPKEGDVERIKDWMRAVTLDWVQQVVDYGLEILNKGGC